jgi:hypothetical protein
LSDLFLIRPDLLSVRRDLLVLQLQRLLLLRSGLLLEHAGVLFDALLVLQAASIGGIDTAFDGERHLQVARVKLMRRAANRLPATSPFDLHAQTRYERRGLNFVSRAVGALHFGGVVENDDDVRRIVGADDERPVIPVL